jgi:ATP-dependent DNA ligase
MAATLVREPFHRDGWIYEEKIDGWRILAYKDGARVRLISRNGRDHTRRFAGIAAAIVTLSARSLVLDGEVAIYDQALRSRFDWLREPDAEAVATPPVLHGVRSASPGRARTHWKAPARPACAP